MQVRIVDSVSEWRCKVANETEQDTIGVELVIGYVRLKRDLMRLSKSVLVAETISV